MHFWKKGPPCQVLSAGMHLYSQLVCGDLRSHPLHRTEITVSSQYIPTVMLKLIEPFIDKQFTGTSSNESQRERRIILWSLIPATVEIPLLQHQPAGWEDPEGLFPSLSPGFCSPSYSITEHRALLACLPTVWANSGFLLSPLAFSFSSFAHLFFSACLHYFALLTVKSVPVGLANTTFYRKVPLPKVLFFRKEMIKKKKSPVSELFREKEKSTLLWGSTRHA